MTKYASSTSVPSDRSRAEIEKTLERYGATGFSYAWSEDQARVAFKMSDRLVSFFLPLPLRDDQEFTRTENRRRERSPEAASKAYEQAVRQKWRALALVIKAKLEAVETEITTFDEEFLAHITLPNGQTVGQFMVPQVANAYATGKMPPLLPGSCE